LSVIQNLLFGLTLVVFDVFQRINFNLFGYNSHKKTVDFMSIFLIYTLRCIGAKMKFISNFEIPKNVPLIIVSNHQSLYDIPPIGWFFKNHHPKYVSKIELGKGIPGISYNLTHGGSVLIDRKDAKQSLTALSNFGKYIEQNNYAAVIFPEGTRSRNGNPKPFHANGLKMLVKYVPSAYIVPVTINNAWKISAGNSLLKPLGIPVTIEAHEPIAVKSMPFEELLQKVENTIKSAVIKS
jgi:1-acyl-sn-glycerol-3-phosphate acyltransferase